ncbi:MAG: serine hydrolase domain-containing protein [Erythrobacter sp.]|uniref:serine hydrolase domain-containing protein n=1 Tax=Erythrobacter sp. TaxID=1042 RepID=UPI003264F662
MSKVIDIVVRKKSWRRTFLGLSAATTLVGCATTPAQVQDEQWSDRPASAERIYLERLRLIQGRARFDYDIMADVPGADGDASELPVVDAGSIAPHAVKEAIQYAEKTNSLALLVWHDGKLITEQYFQGMAATSPMNGKSFPKALASIAIGRAIALGDIKSLDQSVADFVQEWQGTPKAAITIRHALTMHTGLLEQGFDFSEDSPFPRAYLDPYHGRYIIDEYPLTHTPGERFAYANAASDLIAVIIERATGREYEEFVGNELFKPIDAPGGRVWLNREGGLAHSGCCMELPAQTWLRLGVLLANDGMAKDGRLLPEGYVVQMRQPSPDNPHYGLGVWLGSPYLERRGYLGTKSNATGVVHSAPYLAEDVVLFDGNGHQVAYIVPSEKLVILRMGNRPGEGVEWDNSVIANAILGGIVR